MENFPNNSSSCLELTIAMPGFSSSPCSFPSSGESGGSRMRVVDVNLVPSSEREDECMEEEEEDDESPNKGPAAPRKKLRLTKEQSRLLEESFRQQNHTLNPKQKEILAHKLHLKARQVEVWFQNRRARSKLKQTEMECEYLKRWFGSLTEQNKKLQIEVEELRSTKAGHHPDCRHLPPPPSTLTMCPHCQRVTTTTAATNNHLDTNTKMLLLQSKQPSAACFN